MHEADELSHRVGIMHNGKLVAIGKPTELKSKYLREEIEIKYVDNDSVAIKRLESGATETEKLISQLTSQGKLISMNTSGNSLADVFAVLTGRELS